MSAEISVIIVNYNVKAFLQQCIYSVLKAAELVETEVIVVDNNSVDGSVEMLKQNFNQVKLIENKENKGFAFACNQAIKVSGGRYILLLNPDTVVKEDSLKLCYEFMQTNTDAGALGVKMIDGKGRFLPESKRSLPTAKSAFYKMFGLSNLFPKSKIFGSYQLKYLDENELHLVEVLSGAYMFIRKSVLEKTGLLDEDFFMYGEDIDLSYRILQANFKNYYFPQTTIIHYKGESTKKSSLKYIRLFYNAMLIFANKHYWGRKQYFFRTIIKAAIILRAGIALLNRVLHAVYLPILDFIFTYGFYYLLVPFWENYKFSGFKAYSDDLMNIYIPAYLIIWQYFILQFTNYKLNIRFGALVKAVTAGTLVILVIYSLLPENYRFSRALILFGAIAIIIISLINRLGILFLTGRLRGFIYMPKRRTLLIGNNENTSFINYPDILNKQYEICNKINFYNAGTQAQHLTNQLIENIQIYKIETIIFFLKDISTSDIINSIMAVAGKSVEFKIVIPESSSLVGAKSVIDLEKLPQFNIQPISKPTSRTKKRMFDILFSIIMVVLSPFFLTKNKSGIYFKLIWQILINKKTWVSYNNSEQIVNQYLPYLKPGVFSLRILAENEQNIEEMNQLYAKNYHIRKDIIVIFRSLKSSLNLHKHIKNQELSD